MKAVLWFSMLLPVLLAGCGPERLRQEWYAKFVETPDGYVFSTASDSYSRRILQSADRVEENIRGLDVIMGDSRNETRIQEFTYPEKDSFPVYELGGHPVWHRDMFAAVEPFERVELTEYFDRVELKVLRTECGWDKRLPEAVPADGVVLLPLSEHRGAGVIWTVPKARRLREIRLGDECVWTPLTFSAVRP